VHLHVPDSHVDQAVRGNPVRLLDPSGRQSVGQLIEDKALQAIKEDR
jgi:hypothetical protein